VAFRLRCPHCGLRDATEFRWGGERSQRPAPDSAVAIWTRYLYLRDNIAGSQREWWYHRAGCRRWLLAIRDTRNNEVSETFFPTDVEPGDSV